MKKNRIPWGKESFIKEEKLSGEQFEENYGTCHDCGAKFGEIHEYGCDMEECPVCHRQFMGCTEKCIDKIDTDERNNLLNECRKKENNSVRSWDIDFKFSDPFAGKGTFSKNDDDEYSKPFFACDPHCVKKEKTRGVYVLPGGEYCL